MSPEAGLRMEGRRGKIKAGVKAGSLSGAIMGLVGALIGIPLILAFSYQELVIPPSEALTTEALVLFALTVNTGGATVLGALLGAFYGRMYERLPGSTPMRKGLPLGLAAWIVEGPIVMVVTWFLMPPLMQLIRVVASLAGSLIFAVLLGFFYERFARNGGLFPKDVMRKKNVRSSALS